MEETLELKQYLYIIRKWLWLIAMATIIGGTAAYLVSISMHPVYRASATLLIDEADSPNSATYQDILSSERTARTYAELLRKRPILEGTAARLGLAEVDDVEDLPFDVDVNPIRDTQLIELGIESSNPILAAEVANTIPQVFIEQNEAMESRRFASSKENLSRQMSSLEEDIKRTEEAISQLQESETPVARTEAGRLESLLAQQRSSHSSLVQSYEEVRLAEARSLDNVVLVEPAEVARDPVRPRILLNCLSASVVTCMLAVGTAFLIEYFDDTIKSPTDISRALGLSSLATIPRIPGDGLADRLVTVGRARSPISEAYRALRTNIQFSSPDKALGALLITSASPSEGKSVTAANLAVVMAQAGQRVVLVDSDLRRPTLHRIFDLRNDYGLTSALFRNGSGADRYLQEANGVDNLRVLTSGPLPPNPSELLGSQRMSDLIGNLRALAEVVIFDSPPTLPVTDAAVLSRLVDGTILVADAGATRRESAQRAKHSLDQVGANVIGASLNKISLNGDGDQYYYHYYYTDKACHRRSPGRARRFLGRLRHPLQREERISMHSERALVESKHATV